MNESFTAPDEVKESFMAFRAGGDGHGFSRVGGHSAGGHSEGLTQVYGCGFRSVQSFSPHPPKLDNAPVSGPG
jgi:hypothetical protein